jgi:hypothetical protein
MPICPRTVAHIEPVRLFDANAPPLSMETMWLEHDRDGGFEPFSPAFPPYLGQPSISDFADLSAHRDQVGEPNNQRKHLEIDRVPR